MKKILCGAALFAAVFGSSLKAQEMFVNLDAFPSEERQEFARKTRLCMAYANWAALGISQRFDETAEPNELGEIDEIRGDIERVKVSYFVRTIRQQNSMPTTPATNLVWEVEVFKLTLDYCQTIYGLRD